MNEQQINNNQQSIFWNNYSLAITAASAIGLGLLVPISGIALDLLLVFGIMLIAATVLISLSAKNNSEAGGYACMVLGASTIQLTAMTAAAKLFLANGDTGIILSNITQLLAAEGYGQIITYCVLGVVFAIICYSLVKIHQRLSAGSKELIEYVIPLRQVGIEGMQQTGYITEEYAEELLKKIHNEKTFHLTTSKSVLFLLFSASSEILILLTAFVLTANKAQQILAAVSSGTILMTSLFISALCSLHLAKKNAPLEIHSNDYNSDDIYQNTETVEAENENVCLDTHLSTYLSPPEPVSVKSQVIESSFESDYKLWKWNLQTCDQAVDLITTGKTKGDKVFLMASESINNLPVTAAVNTVMKLTKKGLKCLLADFDFVHNSASKVFGAGTTKGVINPKTGISNLHLWSAADSSVNNISAFKNTMVNFAGRYDIVLIYAPAVKGNATKQQIASAVDCAMIFGDDDESDKTSMLKFAKMLQTEKKRILNQSISCQ